MADGIYDPQNDERENRKKCPSEDSLARRVVCQVAVDIQYLTSKEQDQNHRRDQKYFPTPHTFAA